MKDDLNNLFNLLNKIEVKGKQNLNDLLAAIQIVEHIYDNLDKLGQGTGDKNE